MNDPDNATRAERLRQAIRLKKAAAQKRAQEGAQSPSEGRAPKASLPRRPAEEPARLGELQRSLWLAHRLDPASPAYNLVSAFRLQGELSPEALEGAFNEILVRHALLRSTFSSEGAEVRQVIHPPEPRPIEIYQAPREAAGEVMEVATREAARPFDLETGPLVRLLLVEGAGERILVLVLHHLLADERSLAQLWQEMAAVYEEPGALLEAAPQFDDFVAWQRSRPEAECREEERQALEHWRRRMDPPPDPLELPFERSRSKRGSDGKGKLLVRALGRGLLENLRGLAASTAATPFAIGAFAFRLLLHRYAPERRTAFATPVSIRSHPATARMIGYFLNPVVVTAGVDESQPVEAAVRAFNRQLRQDLARGALPFLSLVEALAPSGQGPAHGDRHPLFQAMFVHQERMPPPKLGDCRLEPVTLDLEAPKFDLTLFLTEGEGGLEIAVEFARRRFETVWMKRLLGHYEALLEGLVSDPGRDVREVSLLTAAEERQLEAASRGPELETSGGPLLPRRILEVVQRKPQAPAVVWSGEEQSYGALAGKAAAIARALGEAGIEPGDRVALFLDRSPAMIAAILGCHWAGAAYVPLDPGYPRERTRFVLEDAAVAVVLTTAERREDLPPGAWKVIAVDEVEGTGTLPSLDALPGLHGFEPELPAYLLYTSGSTGRPKGVVVSHANLWASTAARLQVYGAKPERFLLIPSIAFDSSVAGLFGTLAAGGALVIPAEDQARDPRQLAGLVEEQQVESLLVVPSLFHQMLRFGSGSLASLKTAIVAGEACPPQLVEDHQRTLPDASLYNEYGPTEATVWATVGELTGQEAPAADGSASGEALVSIGRPIPGVSVEVLDHLGRLVPFGIPGTAWISGPTVARGYWRRPGLTAQRFAAGSDARRRYRTGDLMAWTVPGSGGSHLRFLGREDEQLKIRGFRIEPGEVEAALAELPSVGRAAVLARAVRQGAAEPVLVAFVEVGDHRTVTYDAEEVGGFPGSESGKAEGLSDWRRHLEDRLPSQAVPSRLMRLLKLPELPNGKVDRRALEELPLEPEERQAEDERLPTLPEQGLISLWEGLLGRTGIGPDDNFFELGGHSLLVAEMTLAIERDFEVSLASTDVFQNPTVKQLARLLERQGGSAGAPYRHLFPLQPRGNGDPFIFAIPHFFSAAVSDHFRGERPVYGLRGVSLRLEGNRGQWPTMEALGEELAEEVRRRFPDQAVHVAGYSFGASMAVEAVRVLERLGTTVHGLYLIAPMALDVVRLGPLRLQLDALRQPVDQLSGLEALRLYLSQNHPLSRRLYQRAWHRLGVGSWRRLLRAWGGLRKLFGLPLTPRILHADVRLERFRLHSRYRPGRIRTPTVIFNPREPETDAAATWRPVFEGPFTVIETPDPHLGGEALDEAKEILLRHFDNLEAG